MSNTINKKLKHKLIEKDMLLYDLAEKTEITSVHASRILNKKSSGSLEWWRKAAEVLGCEVADIIE